MNRESRESRKYDASPLPIFREGVDVVANRDVMLKLYDQICSAWKELVGVRFKLLALVPPVSLAVLTTVLSNKGLAEGMSTHAKLLVALLGLVSVLGLYIYDVRNSALHDDLISRGRRIEEELGVDTGLFRGRLSSRPPFTHGVATNTIYFAAILAWALAFVSMIQAFYE